MNYQRQWCIAGPFSVDASLTNVSSEVKTPADLCIGALPIKTLHDEILKIYNKKSLVSQISSIFGLKNGQLPEYIIQLLSNKDYRESLKDAIRPYPRAIICCEVDY